MNIALGCVCLDNSEHILLMEIEFEGLENSLNKLSRLVIVRMKSMNGISSSWFGLMAGSKVGTMTVSLVAEVVVFVSCAVAVTLCVL